MGGREELSSTASFDYIVVGGGAAGCLIAARLSENPDCRVALLEAGPATRSPLHTIPGLAPFAAKVGRYLWRTETEPEAELGGRRAVLLQGRVLGGSAAVNGMVYTTGHAADYDAWAALGCPGWAAADVRPWFYGRQPRPGLQPLCVRPTRPASGLVERFLAGAAEAGFARVDDLNADVVDGFGLTDVTIAGGRRANTRRLCLQPALRRPNLTVMTSTLAYQLMLDGTRVTGVRANRRGTALHLSAGREVILTAGGLRSPHLLLLSGIGPASHLRSAGVPVRVDLPGVGQNLQNHPSFLLRSITDEPVSLARHLRPLAAVAAAWQWGTSRQGMLAEGIFNAAGFIRTNPDLSAPDAQIVMSPVVFPADAAGFGGMLPRRHGLTLAVQQGSPFSRGELCLASADPAAPPVIRSGAFRDARDVAVLARAIAVARRILAQPSLSGLHLESDLPSDAKALVQAIRQRSGTAYHQSGTCKMGTDALAVVGPDLRVHGVAGLRVADGSVIPRLMNAALQAPTMMIAERAAAMILGIGAGQALCSGRVLMSA